MIESIVYVASLFAISDADAPHSIDALYRKSQCGKQAGGMVVKSAPNTERIRAVKCRYDHTITVLKEPALNQRFVF